MKKIISFIFVLILFFNIFGSVVLAQNGVGFYESMENLQKLKSYSMNQMISGFFDASLNKKGESASGNFSLTIKSDTHNQEAYSPDTKMQITGTLHVDLTGADDSPPVSRDKPFDSIDALARLSIISLPKEGVYVRLEGVDVNVTGIPASDVADYENFRAEMKKEIQLIKWQWIFIPINYFKGQLDETMPTEMKSLVDEEMIRQKFKEQGFQKGLKQLLGDWINIMEKDGSLSAKDASQAQAALDRFFGADFFTFNTVVRPGKEATTAFRLNKNAIIGFIRNTAKELEAEISDLDVLEIKKTLNLFQLSGSYHENIEYQIFDRFNLRIGVNNLDTLKKLQFNVLYKIGNINKDQKIRKPAKSIPIDQADLKLLPQPMEPNDLNELEVAPSPGV